MKPIRAVILAGSSEEGDIIKGIKIKNKALYPINNRPMLLYVLDILSEIAEIKEISVVGPKTELEKLINHYNVTILPHSNGIIDNVITSIKGWEDGRILIVTSDVPMISIESIKDFIYQSNNFDGCQLYYPIVEKDINEKIFPGVKRTYVKLKDGVFTGGNICLVDSECIENAAEQGRQLVKMRKSPLRIANFLGWMFLVKLLTKRLTIADLEYRVSNLLNLRVKAIISKYPQLGTDVDKDTDIEVAENYLKKISNI